MKIQRLTAENVGANEHKQLHYSLRYKRIHKVPDFHGGRIMTSREPGHCFRDFADRNYGSASAVMNCCRVCLLEGRET